MGLSHSPVPVLALLSPAVGWVSLFRAALELGSHFAVTVGPEVGCHEGWTAWIWQAPTQS